MKNEDLFWELANTLILHNANTLQPKLLIASPELYDNGVRVKLTIRETDHVFHSGITVQLFRETIPEIVHTLRDGSDTGRKWDAYENRSVFIVDNDSPDGDNVTLTLNGAQFVSATMRSIRLSKDDRLALADWLAGALNDDWVSYDGYKPVQVEEETGTDE